MLRCLGILAFVCLLGACKPKTSELATRPDASQPPATEAAAARTHPVWGDPIPPEAFAIELHGSSATLLNREPLRSVHGLHKVLLLADADTLVAEASAVLAMLDSENVETWLAHPNRAVAFKLSLKDEHAFQAWLDQPIPGRIRVIQRADGLELQTGLGKLAGADPNGPSIPLREGQLDIRLMRQALQSLRTRFPDATDACLVPSFGTELTKVASAASGFYEAPRKRLFENLCLVYPAPGATSRDH